MLKETLSSMFNIQSRTVNNAIIQLGDTDDSGKGKHFKSRFVQPGIAGYPERDENLLITKESFDRFIHTLKNKPVIINHKDEITEDDKVGEVHNVWYNPDDGWYWCDGVITDKYAMDLIKKHKWSVSCSYDILKADDKGGSENNIKYGMEILDGEFKHLAIVKNPRYERANIVFNSKTQIVNGNPDQPRVPKGSPEGGQFAKKDGSQNISSNPKTEYADIIKTEKYKNLPKELKEAVDYIYNGKPVYNVKGTEFPNTGEDFNTLLDKITQYYEVNFGGKVNVDNFGEVLLDKKSVKNTSYHKFNTNKVNAFAAVPYVLKNGKIANYIENYKDKNEDRYLFVAPITITDKSSENQYFCEVVVKATDRLNASGLKRFYLHEVEIKKKLSDVLLTPLGRTSKSSKSIIADLINNLNPNVKNNKETFEEALQNGLSEIIKNCKPETKEDLKVLKGLKDILEEQ